MVRSAQLRTATALLLVAVLLAFTPSSSAQGESTYRIVIVPDTQIYAQSDAGGAIAQAQFAWAAQQAASTNTIFVTAVGDIVQNPNSSNEWDRLEPGFVSLETASIPYGIAPGNHDLVSGGGDVEFDERFGADRFADAAWFGGSHAAEGNRSSYQYVSMPGHQVLFVHMRHLVASYGPVEPVLAWFDQLLMEHPDHLVFVTTHEFTNGDASVRIPVLQDAIAEHCNVAAVFSGHRPGETARGTFTDACGRSVHHVLTNYQVFPNGGDGFLRTIDIDPLTLAADFAVYSPTLDQSLVGPDEAFTVDLAKLEAVAGDVNCDRTSNVVDALLIAQHAVGNRANHGTCPLPAATTQLDTTAGDRNGDQQVNIVDALLIAQCDAGILNMSCSTPG